MSKIIRTTLVAVALLSGTSAVMARPHYGAQQSDYGSGYDSTRAFWDAQQRNGS
jgi:uncharacterized protein YceK